MLLIRFAGTITAIVIAASLILYMIRGERRYLRFAGRCAQGAILIALGIMALMFLERIIVVL
ncbi:MAG: hypothetical protein JSR19_07900 [Proteobacteria bacterium]|nr:hypothetical protein [Pseudomonadota bacterium]HQR04360.1 hypothetical protein [Rhodocyclaceae bacterium]